MNCILLTGSTGFLGNIIKNEISSENNVLTLSRTNADYVISLEKEIPIFKESFDLVIHAAGKAHSVPKTEIQRKEFYEVNVVGTEKLLKGFENSLMPKQFVFVSSVSVYGHDYGIKINEKCPLKAADAYGLSKIEAEELVINWCKKNNIVCTILRLPLVVGKDAPGNLGAMVKAITRGYYLNVGGGKARKSMVLGRDVATFIMKVSSIGGIYNLTDGVHPSFNELGLAISRNKNKKSPLNLPLALAKIIGKFGDFFRSEGINSSRIKKMTTDLTFDDSKARVTVNWRTQSVIDYINNNKI